MSIDRHQYDIGICPSPGKQKGMSYRTPVGMTQSYDEEANRLTITIYMVPEGRIAPDRIYDIYLCPEDQSCGCGYDAEVGWEIDSNGGVTLSWQWPSAAGCLLKSGNILGTLSGIIYIEELSTALGAVIYPVGDIRNPGCPGCGMSGGDRDTRCNIPVPGELFSLTGCFDEETCIALFGAGGCYPIGSEWYQTVGFHGGRIHDVGDEAGRVYEIWVEGELTGVQGVDMTEYDTDEWIALAKLDTHFPAEEEDLIPVTNANVPTVEVEDDCLLIPYRFRGE